MTIQDRLLSSGPADLGAACVEAADTIDALVEALERISRPLDCGCVPCRGQCRSQIALQCSIDEIQDLARAALARVNGDAP